VSVIDVSVQTDDGLVTVALTGELDISNAQRVEQELQRVEEDDGTQAIVLDLRKLAFMDSTGLRLVVAADARARERGRRFALVPGPEAVHRVFKITYVDRRLDFVDDPSDARTAP
jgi:anti-sigma B factor antagonist